MYKNKVLLFLAFFVVVWPLPDALCQTGRELLFNHGNPNYSGLLASNQKFKDALSTDSNDQEANFFYAVTRIAAFALEQGSGAGLETLRDVFDAFGMTRNSTEFFEDGFPYDTPPELPANSPSGEDIRQFLAGPFNSLLDGALANLNKISSSFQTTLTADETGDVAVEVDYGDVLLLKSMLQASKATLWVISSYNINLNPVQLANNLEHHDFNINTDLLNPNPEFLKLLSGGGTMLNNAKTDIIAAITNYDAASNFIRSESDNQGNDLIALDPEETTDETEFRNILEDIKNSLENNVPVELGNKDEGLQVAFSEFFDDPISIRNYLPSFIYNASTGDFKGAGPFPDTSLSGIFPYGLPPDIAQPVLSGPNVTEVTGDDRNDAVVTLGNVVTGGNQMKLRLKFSPYTAAVDIYTAVQLPDGSLYSVKSDASLTSEFVPYATGMTYVKSATILESFDVCTSFGPSVPTGNWNVYSVVAPTNGGNFSGIDFTSGDYDLRFYRFDVTCP